MTPDSIPLRDGSPDGTAFGEFLRHAREQRGLTLQQISHETKIPWRHLDALEHGRLDAVPGGTYRRGEIRAYAEVVGLDKAVALARLDRALESAAPPTVPAPTPTVLGSRQPVLVVLALCAIGAALLAVSATTSRRVTGPEPLSAAPTVPAATMSNLVLVAEPDAPLIDSAVVPEVVPAIATPPAPEVTPADSVALSNQQPATAPAPPLEGLSLTSDPPGARVTVDGIAWGVTPVSIPHLSPGDRRVRITKEGFMATERVVRLSGARATGTLHVVLQGAPQ